MINTLEQSPNSKPQTPKTREDFLDENDRGFEIPDQKDREEKRAREAAQTAFALIAAKIESGHNID